jgi:dTDP-4-amino-4,6-dideoxygalactose transaminase
MADMSGRTHATLTTNGSSAIVVALHALGIGPGDTVAMPATTWVSCATAVFRVGARPVYLDATEQSPCGTPDSLPEAPDAILAVHLYAQHFDVERARAAWPGVPLIEDASHGQFGLTSDGRRVGSLGDIAIMSLQATKIITCGEGGAVLTDDPELAYRVESLVMDSRRRTRAPLATSPNELEPAFLLHGANHALPEASASLLIDQLSRYPEQARRRAQAAELFVGELDGGGWRVAADTAAVASGAFYGIALRLPDAVGTPDDVVTKVHARTGLVLDRVYPPVPEGPLYRPETVKQYSTLGGAAAMPTSRMWCDQYVVVPHQALLADTRQLYGLADVLRDIGSSSNGTVHGARDYRPTTGTERGRPSVDVVVVTTGRRTTLPAALNSILAQDASAELRTTVWLDAESDSLTLPPELGAALIQVGNLGDVVRDPFDRIAFLRELAVRRCTADFVAFLDDDNEWEPDHLSSLLEIARLGYPAVHSWRVLIDRDGHLINVGTFPWLPDGARALARLDELRTAGVMGDSPVVRDSVDFKLADGAHGMVDMGEWLFDRTLLDMLKFRRPRTEQQISDRFGEDDVLLEQLLRLDVPTRCTTKPTLRYRLGGMSTTQASVPT